MRETALLSWPLSRMVCLMVCPAFGAKSDVNSFIATPVLQNKTHFWLIAAVVAAAVASGMVGFWVGSKSADSQPARSAENLQSPMTIIAANARPADQQTQPAMSSGVPVTQFTQTVGRLHADILTLRTLYRRLAEDAGNDLTDFELNDALASPTEVTGEASDVDENAVLENLSDELGQIKESSSALGNWYWLRSQERVFELAGPVVMRGEMSSRFGWRKQPVTGEQKLHKGVDYSGQVGEPVLALADGVVSYEGQVHAYGNMVELLHADGLRTRYAHNRSNSVSVGQRVEQGQIIAKLGSTGRSTGPHVHVEVHLNGEAVDPMLFIQ